MGVVKKRGHYYWVKRVPKRYQGVVFGTDGKPVQQVRQALHTDSKTLALKKATQVEAARIAEWESALQGRPKDARMHYLGVIICREECMGLGLHDFGDGQYGPDDFSYPSPRPFNPPSFGEFGEGRGRNERKALAGLAGIY